MSVTDNAGYAAAYTYAADGLRLRVQESNAQYTDRWFQYDGVRPVLEGTLEGDTFTTVNRYTWEDNDYSSPLIDADFAGQTRYFLYDGLGSTCQLLDAAQSATDSYSYDAFGNLLSHAGTTPNPYRYLGGFGHYSSATPLISCNGREYVPLMGRLIQPHPVLNGRDYTTGVYNPKHQKCVSDCMGYRERDVWRRGAVGGALGGFLGGVAGGIAGSLCCPGPGSLAGTVGGMAGGSGGAAGGAWGGAQLVRDECSRCCYATNDAPFDYRRYERYQGCMRDLRSKWDAAHPPQCVAVPPGYLVLVTARPSPEEVTKWEKQCARRSK